MRHKEFSSKDFTLIKGVDCKYFYELQYGLNDKETISIYADGTIYVCHQDDADGLDEHWYTIEDVRELNIKHGIYVRASTYEALIKKLNGVRYNRIIR